MDSDRLPRKLAAILYADVAGYSRLMGEDEERTHRRLSSYLDLISACTKAHSGRIVHYAGDAVLADFGTASHALSCAVTIQEALRERNAEIPSEQQVHFRIGVNLGEVIVDRNDIYGDGVNVAARLESLAEAGGICVSDAVRSAVGRKLPIDFQFLGEQNVKNIVEPVRTFSASLKPGEQLPNSGALAVQSDRRRWGLAAAALIVLAITTGVVAWLAPWQHRVEPASMERLAFPLPEQPSIAVLPFDNLTGDDTQEYLSDGLTENIIASLAKIPQLFVIARNSTFAYKNQTVDISRIAEELGVRHVLEGSIQQSGVILRVSAQLIDATKGNHVWSETYDRTMNDFFVVQDDITRHIAVALQGELVEGEQALIRHHSTDDLEAWKLGVRGYALFERYSPGENANARDLFERAVELDPNYAWAWSFIVHTHVVDARFGWSKDKKKSLELAAQSLDRAMAIDDTLPDVHAAKSNLHYVAGQYEAALAAGEKAISLAPSNAENYAVLSITTLYLSDFAATRRLAEKAMRLSPHYPTWYLHQAVIAYRFLGNEDRAIAGHKERLKRFEASGRERAYLDELPLLTITYGWFDRWPEARQTSAELMRRKPEFTAVKAKRYLEAFHGDPDLIDKMLRILVEAGVPSE